MLRHGEFANVVKYSGSPKRLQLLVFHAEIATNFEGVNLNALQMFVCGLVLGFNGQGQRFDRTKVESSHLFGMLHLFVDARKMHRIDLIDEVEEE